MITNQKVLVYMGPVSSGLVNPWMGLQSAPPAGVQVLTGAVANSIPHVTNLTNFAVCYVFKDTSDSSIDGQKNMSNLAGWSIAPNDKAAAVFSGGNEAAFDIFIFGFQDQLGLDLQNKKVSVLKGPAGVGGPSVPTFTFTGSPTNDHYFGMVALLSNGKVLNAGGQNLATGVNTNLCELYDPSTGTWSATGSMSIDRSSAGMVLLQNGKALVVGGYTNEGPGYVNTAELYDPSTGVWTATGTPNVDGGGRAVPLTVLANGKVLKVGGRSGGGFGSPIPDCELYDPSTGLWTITGSLPDGMFGDNVVVGNGMSNQLVTLQNGKVLCVPEYDSSFNLTSNCYLYDPVAGTWGVTGSTINPSANLLLVLLQNGKVLKATGNWVITCELYDPSTGTWSATGSLNNVNGGIIEMAYTVMHNGKVLLCDGVDINNSESPTPQLYDPSTGVWTATASKNLNKAYSAAITLSNGTVLVCNGADQTGSVANSEEAEIFSVAAPSPWQVFQANPPAGVEVLQGTVLAANYYKDAGHHNLGAPINTNYIIVYSWKDKDDDVDGNAILKGLQKSKTWVSVDNNEAANAFTSGDVKALTVLLKNYANGLGASI